MGIHEPQGKKKEDMKPVGDTNSEVVRFNS